MGHNDENMTVQDVAGHLKVSEVTALGMLHEKRFPNAFKLGRRWRIPRTDLENFKNAGRVGSAAAAHSPKTNGKPKAD